MFLYRACGYGWSSTSTISQRQDGLASAPERSCNPDRSHVCSGLFQGLQRLGFKETLRQPIGLAIYVRHQQRNRFPLITNRPVLSAVEPEAEVAISREKSGVLDVKAEVGNLAEQMESLRYSDATPSRTTCSVKAFSLSGDVENLPDDFTLTLTVTFSCPKTPRTTEDGEGKARTVGKVDAPREGVKRKPKVISRKSRADGTNPEDSSLEVRTRCCGRESVATRHEANEVGEETEPERNIVAGYVEERRAIEDWTPRERVSNDSTCEPSGTCTDLYSREMSAVSRSSEISNPEEPKDVISGSSPAHLDEDTRTLAAWNTKKEELDSERRAATAPPLAQDATREIGAIAGEIPKNVPLIPPGAISQIVWERDQHGRTYLRRKCLKDLVNDMNMV